MNDILGRLFGDIKRIARDVTREEIRSLDSNAQIVRLGTITDTVGPKVRFDGDTAASGMAYKRLAAYTPVLNDRVLLLKVGNSWVIVYKVL